MRRTRSCCPSSAVAGGRARVARKVRTHTRSVCTYNALVHGRPTSTNPPTFQTPTLPYQAHAARPPRVRRASTGPPSSRPASCCWARPPPSGPRACGAACSRKVSKGSVGRSRGAGMVRMRDQKSGVVCTLDSNFLNHAPQHPRLHLPLSLQAGCRTACRRCRSPTRASTARPSGSPTCGERDQEDESCRFVHYLSVSVCVRAWSTQHANNTHHNAQGGHKAPQRHLCHRGRARPQRR